MQKVFSAFFWGLVVLAIPAGFIWPLQGVLFFWSLEVLALVSGLVDYGQMTKGELRKYLVIERRRGRDIEWPIAPEIPAEKMLRLIN